MTQDGEDRRELTRFLVQLGAAMNASGQPVDVVQERLVAVARAYGADSVRVSAFPTYLMVTMGRGEPATLELTTPLGRSPRLDEIAAVDRLGYQALRAQVTPAEGIRCLAAIRDVRARFSPPLSIAGYSILTVGICLVLRPALVDVAAAAVLGAIVGVLRWLTRRQPTLRVLMPVVAAFTVAALTSMAVNADVADLGLRAIVSPLVVFLPGATLTTGVLELGSGEMISGSSRLVSGVVELALLAFGILAGIQAVGVPAEQVFAGSGDLLGLWAPWLGVLFVAVGVTLAYSAPKGSLPGLLIVLYAAWTAQLTTNALLGGYVSALIGAAVLTLVAFSVARLPSAMPPHASFLPGFWLLVPGAIGLIGLTQYAGSGGSGSSTDLFATIGSIFGVALGVLCGTQLRAWAVATGRVVNEVTGTLAERSTWLQNRHRARRQPATPSVEREPPEPMP